MYQSNQGEVMNPFVKFALPLLGLALSMPDATQAQERDRSKIPDQYKWNLADIYSSDSAWKEAKQKLIDALPAVGKYQGSLDSSAQQLLGCLDLVTSLNKEFARLYSYASMSLDQDTRAQSYLGLQQEMSQLGAEYGAQVAFIEPEILKMDPVTVQTFLLKEKKLEIYRHYLDDILRRRAHTGTEGEEKIIADAGLMEYSPTQISPIRKSLSAMEKQ
jgi:oligoendopeptidase F